jgi:hypothetical protein
MAEVLATRAVLPNGCRATNGNFGGWASVYALSIRWRLGVRPGEHDPLNVAFAGPWCLHAI